MICIMLMGAWFLIHQQCCLADAGVPPRTVMVDPLMRRSPLEKNFIRFGRSRSTDGDELAVNLEDDAARGPVKADGWSRQEGPQRETRGKENFIRFGRSRDRFLDGPLSPPPPEGRFSAADWPPARFISRITRSKQNFIRFGRSNDLPNKNKKYSGLNKDNFIRFGRGLDEEIKSEIGDRTTGEPLDDGRDKKKAKQSHGFIRFGKSVGRPFAYEPVLRERRDAEPAPPEGKERRCADRKPPNFDPMTMVAPEFLVFPKIPFLQTPLKDNFVRLG
ncbi:Hypothetical protein NTJ_04297 [Nesidiocoris tenuis]|uniref:Uncharacterized protein n=1 Tax=Nesidiocoris tenuis TaxID=355587 RepID=A0ABN7AJD4_9HEMI|nr:Hypothetical protein NTJ_04297 [Nesidiocoris tenuis]